MESGSESEGAGIQPGSEAEAEGTEAEAESEGPRSESEGPRSESEAEPEAEGPTSESEAEGPRSESEPEGPRSESESESESEPERPRSESESESEPEPEPEPEGPRSEAEPEPERPRSESEPAGPTSEPESEPEAEPEAEGPTSESQPEAEGRVRVPALPVGWAVVAVALLLCSAVLPSGLPRRLARQSAYPWRGLGFELDEHLFHGIEVAGQRLEGGRLRWERSVIQPDGNEIELASRSSLGAEVVIVAIYLASLLAGAWLLRRGARRVLQTSPWARAGPALLDVLSVLVPLFLLGGLIGGVIAARLDGGLPLRRAIYLFAQPLLSVPLFAAFLVFRFVLLAPLAEELVWRGVVYLGLRSRLGAVPSAVACSLAFAGWHFLAGWSTPHALAVQYVFALAACYLVERTGSLWPGVALHAVGNACALLLYALCMNAPEHLVGLFGA